MARPRKKQNQSVGKPQLKQTSKAVTRATSKNITPEEMAAVSDVSVVESPSYPEEEFVLGEQILTPKIGAS